jgi:hypothetical protein
LVAKFIPDVPEIPLRPCSLYMQMTTIFKICQIALPPGLY